MRKQRGTQPRTIRSLRRRRSVTFYGGEEQRNEQAARLTAAASDMEFVTNGRGGAPVNRNMVYSCEGTWYTTYNLVIRRFISFPSMAENSAILKFR